MTKMITIHSSRGGVGKTLIAVNLAMAFAKQGEDTCLIDLDFRAPSLSTIFQIKNNFWVNDFLDDRARMEDVLVDVSSKYKIEGRLLVGLADPARNSIRNMASKDRKWEMKAFKKLISLKSELADKGIGYGFFDTSPGMLYSSINAVACSDAIIVVTTANISEAEETQQSINELYQAFEKPTYIFMNKVKSIFQWKEAEKKTLSEKFAPMFHVPIISIVPCYCELLQADRTTIYTLELVEHPFSKAIYDTANKLTENLAN